MLDAILTELLIAGTPSPLGEPPLVYTTVWYFVAENARFPVEQARSRLPPSYQGRVKILSLATLEPFA